MYNHFISAEILKDGEVEEDNEEENQTDKLSAVPESGAGGSEIDIDNIINNS